MLMVCSAAAPTASPHANTSSATSRSISVYWPQIRCIERNGPITNYTVEFQEVGGALIPGVVVNRMDSLLTQTTPSESLESITNGTGPFTNVTSILTEEESNG